MIRADSEYLLFELLMQVVQVTHQFSLKCKKREHYDGTR